MLNRGGKNCWLVTGISAQASFSAIGIVVAFRAPLEAAMHPVVLLGGFANVLFEQLVESNRICLIVAADHYLLIDAAGLLYRDSWEIIQTVDNR